MKRSRMEHAGRGWDGSWRSPQECGSAREEAREGMIQGTRKDPLCCGASNETATVQSVQWTLPRAACEHGWGGGEVSMAISREPEKGTGKD